MYRGYVDPVVSKMHFNGKEAIGVAIAMRDGGDVIRMGKELDAAVARVQAAMPVGVEIHAVSNQPEVVQESIHEFTKSLAEAIAIVLAVCFFSLGWRTGIVVALSIPLVLAITFLVMYALGIDLQRISLGALIIALGLLVDDAIIAVEMMVLKLEQGWDRVRAASFAYTATAFPMLTGTLITAAGFLPVGLAKSSAGEYTISIFQVVGIALDRVLGGGGPVHAVPRLQAAAGMKKHDAGHDAHAVDTTRASTDASAALLELCLHHRGLVLGIDAGPVHRFARPVQRRAAAVLPRVEPPRTDGRPVAARGGEHHRHRAGRVEAGGPASEGSRRRVGHQLHRRRQPALLPAARRAAAQHQLRPADGHDQGHRRARARARTASQAASRQAFPMCVAACRGWRTARPSAIRCNCASPVRTRRS